MQNRPVVLDKCKHLRRMLEAATDPVEGGRLIRDGVDAEALSRAADELGSVAARASEQIFQNGLRVSSCTGIEVQCGEDPQGPFKTVPLNKLKMMTVTSRDRGASFLVLAALRRVQYTVGFPVVRWNLLQSVSPGDDHRRYWVGDVIPSGYLHKLAQAEDLLIIEEESNPGWDAGISLDDGKIVKVLQNAFIWKTNAELAPPQTLPDATELAHRTTVEIPQVPGELTLTQAAGFYADLTDTKPDKSNTRRRLREKNRPYTIEYIAKRARAANKRKSKQKQRELMSESDLPQQCMGCGETVMPPELLWKPDRLCSICYYDSGCNRTL